MSVIEEKRLHAQRVAKKCAAIVYPITDFYEMFAPYAVPK